MTDSNATQETIGRTLTGNEIVFSMGWNMAGYSPECDTSVFTSARDARSALADALDQFIDHEAESAEMEADSEDRAAVLVSGFLWDGQAYAEAARDMLQHDHHADLRDWVNADGSINVMVEDVRGYSHSYWVSALRINGAYGNIAEAEKCAEWDDNTANVLDTLCEDFRSGPAFRTTSLQKAYRAR